MLQGFRRLTITAALLGIVLLTSGTTWASGPARTETLAVGPYIIDFNLYQDPPYVDTPLEVTVVPHNHSLHLQGDVTAEPGLGTDATSLHFHLAAEGDQQGTLQGTIRMPVRGAWNLLIDLSGPEGAGTGQVAVTVAAPGAIPVWLGWLIGASPLSLIAFWIWRQHRYKRSLLAQAGKARPRPDERETS
ncbi:MAG TPA: hypothetical protein VFU69_16670 [Ktedonobacterales bacterium]|nr:hypothetical protein [Ktedonobacterales bacterium]